MIQTPDGTILCSRHSHDYVTHLDANGKEYSVDGGTSYLSREVYEDAPYTELSLFVGDPHEEVRKYFARGGYGKNGDQPLKYVPLKDMSDKWLINVINYILKGNYRSEYERINQWLEYPDNRFLIVRPIMPMLILHHMKTNGIKNYILTEVYIKELSYRVDNNIFIPEEQMMEVKKPSFFNRLLKKLGL